MQKPLTITPWSSASSSSLAPSGEIPRPSSSYFSYLTRPPPSPEYKALFEAVIADTRQPPLSFSNFESFVIKERSLELLQFYMAAQLHVKLARDGKAEAAIPAARDIISRFIADSSPSQINISGADRDAILSKVASNPDVLNSPLLFDSALEEVTAMLVLGPFRDFFATCLTNLSRRETSRRYFKSSCCLVVALCLLALFISLQLIHASTVLASPFFRLICFIPLLFACENLFSARCKVCTTLAYRGVQMRENDSYAELVKQRHGDDRRVLDALVRSSLERIGSQVFFKGLGLAVLATGLLLALPPYN